MMMSKVLVMGLLGVIALALVLTAAEMPDFGDAAVPARNSSSTSAAHYLEKGKNETRVLNILSAILVDYRAYDTLIETTVLFTATAAVLAVVSEHKKRR